jgi:hypothetical protein
MSNWACIQAEVDQQARQVYKQKLVYRIVVVVNDGAHLWINPVYSTRSNVYLPHKPVGQPCMCLVEKMDKNPRRAKCRVFAQSVPVDMQKLIHSTSNLNDLVSLP